LSTSWKKRYGRRAGKSNHTAFFLVVHGYFNAKTATRQPVSLAAGTYFKKTPHMVKARGQNPAARTAGRNAVFFKHRFFSGLPGSWAVEDPIDANAGFQTTWGCITTTAEATDFQGFSSLIF
jgi:hypothetical protein